MKPVKVYAMLCTLWWRHFRLLHSTTCCKGCGKSWPHRDSNPNSPAPQLSVYRLSYTGLLKKWTKKCFEKGNNFLDGLREYKVLCQNTGDSAQNQIKNLLERNFIWDKLVDTSRRNMEDVAKHGARKQGIYGIFGYIVLRPTNAQLFLKLSHSYMFRHYRVILRELCPT
jgi:hypothetical protein